MYRFRNDTDSKRELECENGLLTARKRSGLDVLISWLVHFFFNSKMVYTPGGMASTQERPKQLPLPDPALRLESEDAPLPDDAQSPVWQPCNVDTRVMRGYTAIAKRYGVSPKTVRDAITQFGTAYEVHLYLISQTHDASDGE